MDPCQNDGTCFNNNITLLSFICLCPPDIGGVECENNYRICQSDTCWNNGRLNAEIDKENVFLLFFILQVVVWKHPTRHFSALVQLVGKIPTVNYSSITAVM